MTDDDALPQDDAAPEPAGSEGEQPNAEVGVKRQRNQAKREKEEEDAFWRSVFDSPVGRRVMWRLLTERLHAFEAPFKVGPTGFPHPEATWFAAGQHAIGQRLYQDWLIVARPGVLAMHDECDPAFPKPKRGK